MVTLEDTRYQHLEVGLADGSTISFQVPRFGLVYEPFNYGNPKITPEEASFLCDFTFNSISYDIQKDILHDYCSGIPALESLRIEACSADRAQRDPEIPLRVIQLYRNEHLSVSEQTLLLLRQNVRDNYPLSSSLYKLTITTLKNILTTGGSIDTLIRLLQLLDLSDYFFPKLSDDKENRLDRLRRIWRTDIIQSLQGIKQTSAFLLPLLLPKDLNLIEYDLIDRSLQELHHLQISDIQRQFIRKVSEEIARKCQIEDDFVDCFLAAFKACESDSEYSAPSRAWGFKSTRISMSIENHEPATLLNPFEFESDFLFNANQTPIQPGILGPIEKNENCIVRFDICNDYTVSISDIEDRQDLYQYHVQRVERMAELLKRILSWMKFNGISCGSFPMWIHVNDGTPPIRKFPIFCYALPFGFDNGILFPDWSFVDGYNCDIRGDWDAYRGALNSTLKQAPTWENKEGKLFFSGRDTTKKLGIRNLFSKLTNDIFSIHIQDDDNYNVISESMIRVDQWSNFRYLLDLPGAYPWSVRFKELFLYGGVVIKIDLIDSLRRRPRWVNFYNSFFEEGKHYFRFDLAYSGDIDEDIESIERLEGELCSLHYQLENDSAYASKIARQGQERANELTMEKVIGYCAFLMQKYRRAYFVS